MKKLLKLSLIFSVLMLIFAGCSRDNNSEGSEGRENIINAPKPTATAAGITVTTLSVNRLRQNNGEWAKIEYKVTGKRQAGTELTHSRVFYGLKRKNENRLEALFQELKDPSKEPNGYYTETITIGGLPYESLDFSEIKVAIGYDSPF